MQFVNKCLLHPKYNVGVYKYLYKCRLQPSCIQVHISITMLAFVNCLQFRHIFLNFSFKFTSCQKLLCASILVKSKALIVLIYPLLVPS